MIIKMKDVVRLLCAGFILALAFTSCVQEGDTISVVKGASEETTNWTTSRVFIRKNGTTQDTTALIRLYNGNKYVAYMGMGRAITTMAQLNLVGASYADGVYSYTVKNDGETFVMAVNPKKGTVYIPNYVDFSSASSSSSISKPVLRNTRTGIEDDDDDDDGTGSDHIPSDGDLVLPDFPGFNKKTPVNSVAANTNIKPFTYELSKYGLKMYEGVDDAYLPLAAICSILSLTGRIYAWNGTDIIYRDFETTDRLKDFTEWRSSDTRQKELIDYTYNMLCFTHDYCYGHPGYYGLFDEDGDGYNLGDEELKTAAADKLGLDALLKKYDNETYVKLRSESYSTYLQGLAKLMNYIYGDVHTTMYVPDVEPNTINTKPANEVEPSAKAKVHKAVNGKLIAKKSLLASYPKRDDYAELAFTAGRVFPLAGVYKKTDNKYTRYVSFDAAETTAVIHFDEFRDLDTAGWSKQYPLLTAWYAKKAEAEKNKQTFTEEKPAYPDDDLGLFYYAFDLIEQKSTVKNVVVDLSVNNGGSVPDVGSLLAFLASNGTNTVKLIDQDAHTSSEITTIYTIDLNLDGSVNNKDEELCAARMKKYKYAVLTSEMSFSSANLFPVMAKDYGIKIIGKRSLGGSCSIGAFVTADGFTYYYSIAQRGVPADKQYTTMESGAAVDIEIDYADDAAVKIFYDESKIGEAVEKAYQKN